MGRLGCRRRGASARLGAGRSGGIRLRPSRPRERVVRRWRSRAARRRSPSRSSPPRTRGRPTGEPRGSLRTDSSGGSLRGESGVDAWSTPTGIGDSEIVVGFANASAAAGGNFDVEVFVWSRRGGIHGPGLPFAGETSEALGVSDSGEVDDPAVAGNRVCSGVAPPLAPEQARSVFGDELDLVVEVVAGLGDTDLVRPTGCVGWRVADLVGHLRLDAEAVLASLASTTGAPADRNAVSYWSEWPGGGRAGFAAVRSTWAIAAAYRDGRWLLSHFEDMRAAASQAGRSAVVGRRALQGHVLEVEDLLAMRIVEVAVHHRDLVVDLPGRPRPLPGARDLLGATLEGCSVRRGPAGRTGRGAGQAGGDGEGCGVGPGVPLRAA